jgi:hypothetical protein
MSQESANSGRKREEIKQPSHDYFLVRLFKTYDTNFLLSLGLQYFNTGLKGMTSLSVMNIFKNQFSLTPA